MPPQIINVDDNTVAFAQWGLGTMGAAGETPLPDTVVSKRSRHSTAAPPSAGKTPGEQAGAGNGGRWAVAAAAGRWARPSSWQQPVFHAWVSCLPASYPTTALQCPAR